MENDKENKGQSNKIIVGVLIVLLLASVGYTYYNNSKANELEIFLNEEKDEIQKGLDKMIVQYDEAIATNSELSEELEDERELIIKFRDSVLNLKQANKSIIRRYRKKIGSLEASNKELFEQNEELKSQNTGLNQQIDSANDYIGNQNKKLDSLNQMNSDLNDKVAKGAVLKVNSVNVNSMRKRNNGQLRETSRSRNTDALRVSFVIAENSLAKEGSKKVFLQIMDQKGGLVIDKGIEKLNDDITEIHYSDIFDVDFINEKLEVISVINVERKEMHEGTYTINVYLDGRFVGVTSFSLK